MFFDGKYQNRVVVKINTFFKLNVDTLNLVKKQQKTIVRLETEEAKKDQQNLKIDDALLLMRKRIFGKSSEK